MIKSAECFWCKGKGKTIHLQKCLYCEGKGFIVEVHIGMMVFTPNSHYGHLMTWEEFVESCECGLFIDYDGFGRYSDGDFELQGKNLKPSDLKTGNLLHGFSHVVWYNR